MPAFFSDQGFAFDKPAHAPCRHLTRANQCRIHAGLAARGFPGCVAFDCHGAGQRVTQELFRGIDWRTADATTVQAIFAAYVRCLSLHRLMAMLVIAEAIGPPELQMQLRLKRSRLDELCRSTEADDGTLDTARLQKEISALVMSVAALPARL